MQAFNRFGLGGSPRDAIPSDPVVWLNGQLSGTDPFTTHGFTQYDCLTLVANVQAAVPHSPQQTAARKAIATMLAQEQYLSLQAAVTTTTPFRERLVRFWTNHFGLLPFNSLVTEAMAGNFVREAIRPYVNDTFVNMLIAVVQHPAMICSLDNDSSTGPNSLRGLRQGLGFNENLARELLELYTVGIDAGYSQADVDGLALMLTGYTVSISGANQGFTIDENWHEPGPQTLMGVTYPGTIFDAFEALQFLGTHPQTYQHLATKLVEHFVSDTPDPADVATIFNALSTSGGSLSAAALALVGLSSAWQPLTKLRKPSDFVIAAMRSVTPSNGVIKTAVTDLASLGEPMWTSFFPNGWSDLGADWASPSQMMLRTNWANKFCNTFRQSDPAAAANVSLGPFIAPATINMMARVQATHDKLCILYCSPEFQRR